MVPSGKFRTWPGKTMLPSCRAGDSFKQEVGWDASGGPWHFCHPLVVPPQPCCTLLLPHPVPLCRGLCFPRKGQVDETLPVALIHEHRRKLAPFRGGCWGSAGCPRASWGLQPWFEAEPRAVPGASPQAGLAACPSMPEPSFSLPGSLNLLVRVRNKRAIDTQVWSLSGNRGNMWQQAHVPINPPGPFQVSQAHSQGATCHCPICVPRM